MKDTSFHGRTPRGRRTGLGGLRVALAGVALAAAAFVFVPVRAAEVNVYSARKEVLIRPLFDAFEAETGIAVNLVSGKADALLERLRREGRNTPADLLLTTDAGRLARAKDAELLQPVDSPVLAANIPAQYIDRDRTWFGLSLRARPIMYARERVDPATLSTYEALAGPEWRGRICIRSSNNIYNQSLLAALIHHLGPGKAEAWAQGMVANFARRPQGGDRDQLRAVAAGECDVAIANTYYLAKLATSPRESDRAAAAKIAIFWPNQASFGVHVNVSGAGVTRYAKNRAAAVRLLEFLSGDEAQRLYAETVYEYPVKPGVPVADLVASWGTFKADDINLSILGENNAEAVRIFDRVGWP